jgi:DGQHR domain-containing protein
MVGTSLNTPVYRGFAKASDLARISEPDVFDQNLNPDGTQRDLKPWHAREAHAYALGNVKRETKNRLWPEIILNVRDGSVVLVSKQQSNITTIAVNEEKIKKTNGMNPQISRVDGNHRLHWVQGQLNKGIVKLEPLDVTVPFCITIGLSRIEEAALFRDINANQVKMDTSHLDHLSYVLLGKDKIQTSELALWMAMELHQRPESPFWNSIYLGGRKAKGAKYIFSLRTFKEGIEILLKNSTELSSEKVPFDLQAKAISNFWSAVKIIFSEEWKNLGNYLILTYFAYFAWSKLGAIVIDTSFRKEDPTIDGIKSQLEGIKGNIDWGKDGTFKGFGGKGGGDKAFQILKKFLPVEYELEKSLKKLKG